MGLVHLESSESSQIFPTRIGLATVPVWAGGVTQEHGGKDPQMQVRILARSTNLQFPLDAFRFADFLPLE